MAPTGARAAGVHNSPLAIAVPGGELPALCLDMATSVVAAGRLDVARDKGIAIPAGWALDADGQPTTDPLLARIMVPAGGYKGYGLALMFECLSSLAVGNPLLAPVFAGQAEAHPRPGTQNGIVAAIDLEQFTDLDAYRANSDATIEGIKRLPRLEGVDEVFVPGELENREAERRRQLGIPLPGGTIRNLRAVAEELGVPLPSELAP
jgi:LDH2 family malate/lactate/ureidoglycolate dehydrogenase